MCVSCKDNGGRCWKKGMLIPCRCITCGKPVGVYWEEYLHLMQAGETPHAALAWIPLSRECCRRMMISHSDITAKLLLYMNLVKPVVAEDG